SQFMSGDPEGPIGMSEETDHRSVDLFDDPVPYPTAGSIVRSGARAIEVLPRQLEPKSGAARPAAQRHRERVAAGNAPLYVADDDERHRELKYSTAGRVEKALSTTGDVFALALDAGRSTF